MIRNVWIILVALICLLIAGQRIKTLENRIAALEQSARDHQCSASWTPESSVLFSVDGKGGSCWITREEEARWRARWSRVMK
jgi:hypothetical protein